LLSPKVLLSQERVAFNKFGWLSRNSWKSARHKVMLHEENFFGSLEPPSPERQHDGSCKGVVSELLTENYGVLCKFRMYQ